MSHQLLTKRHFNDFVAGRYNVFFFFFFLCVCVWGGGGGGLGGLTRMWKGRG